MYETMCFGIVPQLKKNRIEKCWEGSERQFKILIFQCKKILGETGRKFLIIFKVEGMHFTC